MILHLLWSGGTGGIEKLCLNIGKYDKDNNLFLFVHSKGTIYQQMSELGINTKCLNLKSKDIFDIYRAVLKKLKEKNIEALIVHHDSIPLWVTAYLLKKRTDVKTYIYAHSEYNYFIKNNLQRIIFKKACQVSDGILAISDYVKTSVVNKMPEVKNKINVIYNGIEIGNIEKRNKKFEKKIVYVGRLINDKGIENILKAVKEIDCSFDIIGDGILKEELKLLIDQYKLNNRVRLLGNRNDVNKLLCNYDVFVHVPTLEEGFGLTVVEAMAAGLSVIVSDSGALVELVDDCVNGHVVKKGDIFSLKEILTKILNNYETDEEISIRKNGIVTANRYTIKNYINNLYEIIR